MSNGIAISFHFPNDILFFIVIIYLVNTNNQQRLESIVRSLRGLTFIFNYGLMHFMTRDSPPKQPGVSFHGFSYAECNFGTSVWRTICCYNAAVLSLSTLVANAKEGQ